MPKYAHLSMILGDDGQKLSKRHGTVSVMQYEEDGYLPEAVINYLSRLGWSHGNDEIFSMEQFRTWFDLAHITPSAAQFNTEKLNWLNQHYIKQTNTSRLVELIRPRLQVRNVSITATPTLEDIVDLYKERVVTLNELTDAAEMFYIDLHPNHELLNAQLSADAKPALQELAEQFRDVTWEREAIGAAIKMVITKHGLKMPKLAMPLRVILMGQTQTPSVDAVVQLFSRETVLARMAQYL